MNIATPWVMSLILIAGPLTGQLRLPHALQTHRGELTEPVLRVLQSTSTLEEMQLDSTITYRAYDAGGGNYIEGAVEKTVYDPVSPGIVRAITSVPGEGRWHFATQLRVTSDERGRTVRQFAETWDRQLNTWLPESRLEMFYRGNSPDLLDSLYVEIWSDESREWVRSLLIRNTYDNDDRMLGSLTYMNIDGYELGFEDEYLYNDQRDNHLINTYLTVDDERTLAGFTTMTYADHLLREEIQFSADDTETGTPESRTTYTYTDALQQDSVATYLWDPAEDEWAISGLDNYDYGTGGLVSDVFTTAFDPDDGEEKSWINYAYVAGTPYLHEVKFHTLPEGSNFYFRNERTRYFYQDVSTAVTERPRAALPLLTWPNPTHGPLEIKLEEPVELYLYDQTGRLLSTHNWSPGQDKLNLSDLPPGTYYLGATTRRAHYTARLLKI
ncbi:T9SS type A sorting domain-containing protein [Lewinella sp. JB7]|uniref:T9SS type A sorting domain-containing protein n=1 Tax=Lewinella sp. JB7 TaxID=2962887 RepID=UPI0020CA0050|nr:T9SS type A sorting domain-containing protein [Lewinella sp. JB7]MCP9234603.1 T9SS type A sorting domain-containing protein [Lewinella sp. JB7]